MAQKRWPYKEKIDTYTSDSTAENQKVSEKAYAGASRAEPMIRMGSVLLISSRPLSPAFLARVVKRNRIVAPQASTDDILIEISHLVSIAH